MYKYDIIAITVSTNYEDILKIIIPQNAKFFKKWIIITKVDDIKTINITIINFIIFKIFLSHINML